MTEKRNYNKFYINFSEMLYKKNCTDNYVGMLFKVLKTFFLYLNQSKGFETGIFYRQFHVIKEEIPIIVLSQEQLKFLIKDKDFEKMLSPSLLLSKDLFVVGCTIGLRFSDLLALKPKNWIIENESHYIVTLSKKTSVETRIKIPLYIVQIINKYKSQYNTLLPPMSLNKFNGDLKQLCFMAGWDYDVGKTRSKRGVKKEIKKDGNSFRFCDLASSHMMRRTAITTLLTLGMPEQIVRKISGHKPNSKEFYKYVKYSESFQDDETDKAFSKFLTI